MAALPLAAGRNVVDVMRVLAIASPRIAHIVEEIRAKNVTSQSPPGEVAVICHLHRAESDIIYRFDIPAAVVKAARIGFCKGNQMMIAAVNAVHERDPVSCSIRKS